VNNLEGLAH